MTKPILMDVPVPIVTPRLILKPREIAEGCVVAKAIAESHSFLKPWMAFAKEVPSTDEMEEHCRASLAKFILREDFTLSIYDRAGGSFLGSTGLHRPKWSVPSFHIGYWLHQRAEGKGIASEAVNALVRYAFHIFKAQRLEIHCDAANTRSLSVALRLGFKVEGTFGGDARSFSGELRDTIVTARRNAEGLPDLKVTWGQWPD